MSIASAHNPHLKEARKLQQRRTRHETQRMLLEGIRLLKDAWGSGVRPECVFYDETRPTGSDELTQLLGEFERQGIECLACTPQAFASLSETITPQGLAAIVPLPHLPLPRQASLVLILDAVREPGNAGGLLRSAEAAGVDFVVFAPESVDPFNEKVVRAAMGTHFRLPLHICHTWQQVWEQLPSSIALYVAEAHAERHYDQVNWQAPAALAIGSEAHGPSQEVRQRATPLTIPMQGGVESLNAAVAGAVILFEAARQRRLKHS